MLIIIPIEFLNDKFKNICIVKKITYFCNTIRRDGRVVECGGLENRCTATYRGFESLSLRSDSKTNKSQERTSPVKPRFYRTCLIPKKTPKRLQNGKKGQSLVTIK